MRDVNVSSVAATFRATLLSRSGSNFAESSSLAMIRATVMPSVDPGGVRDPPASAFATTSFRRDVDRDR